MICGQAKKRRACGPIVARLIVSPPARVNVSGVRQAQLSAESRCGEEGVRYRQLEVTAAMRRCIERSPGSCPSR
jgi:hypothetical protein